MKSIKIVFYTFETMFQVFYNFVESNRKNSFYDFGAASTVDELDKCLAPQYTGIVLFAVEKSEELVQITVVLKKYLEDERMSRVRFVGFNIHPNPKSVAIFQLFGLKDILPNNISLPNFSKKISEIVAELKKLSEQDLPPKKTVAFVAPSPSFSASSTTSPLRTESATPAPIEEKQENEEESLEEESVEEEGFVLGDKSSVPEEILPGAGAFPVSPLFYHLQGDNKNNMQSKQVVQEKKGLFYTESKTSAPAFNLSQIVLNVTMYPLALDPEDGKNPDKEIAVNLCDIADDTIVVEYKKRLFLQDESVQVVVKCKYEDIDLTSFMTGVVLSIELDEENKIYSSEVILKSYDKDHLKTILKVFIERQNNIVTFFKGSKGQI